MSTIEKGNKLEDEFYDYLCKQRDRGDLVYDAYLPHLCKLHKKKSYYCGQRKADVEFDVVIEVFRQGSSEPHVCVIFECKNHARPIQERDVVDFSDKIGRIFGHSAKGIMVVSSGLQAGAENLVRSRKIGLAKYVKGGFEIAIDRKGKEFVEIAFLRSQLFESKSLPRHLEFSAYSDGRFFGSMGQLLGAIDPDRLDVHEDTSSHTRSAIPFVSFELIQHSAKCLLDGINYIGGEVDLVKACSHLGLDLTYSQQVVLDHCGRPILGSANFYQKSILINFHDNEQRERFTIAHEIGHFSLYHDQYLRAETIVEQDLLINGEVDSLFNYDRLEYQANVFASEFLLPEKKFLAKIIEFMKNLDMKFRGHGVIFVDNQPCNFKPYNQLLTETSMYFEVSKRVVEIKLKRIGLLNDQRK